MAEHATLVVIKPDAIKRELLGATLSKLEPLHLEIIGAKAVAVSQELAEAHYHHIKDKPFFRETVQHLMGTLHGVRTVLALVLWGEEAIERVRIMTGATNPERAEPTTIRGAFGRNTASGLMENVIHSSSNPEEAGREIALWFRPEELLRRLPGMPQPTGGLRAGASR